MDRDDFDGTLMLMRMMGPAIAIAWLLLVIVALAMPLAIYLLARWRDSKQPVADPQLGLKVAFGFFGFLGLHALLAGATLILDIALSDIPSDFKGPMYRNAFGLVVPGGLVLAMHVWLLSRTNQVMFSGVRRLILGMNLLVTGTAGFVALVIAFEALFMKGSSSGMGRLGGSMLVVYGAAWVGNGLLLAKNVLATGVPPDAMYPPAAPPPAPNSPPPGLPSLGGGAFPPLTSSGTPSGSSSP